MVRDDGYIKLLDFGLALAPQLQHTRVRSSPEHSDISRRSAALDNRPPRRAISLSQTITSRF